MTDCRFDLRVAVAVMLIVILTTVVSADDTDPPRDVDVWHEAMKATIGGPLIDEPRGGWDLGIYPNLGVTLGPPDWISYQLNAYLSLSRRGSFSLFAGYGVERGFTTQSQLMTLGWGGVRRLEAGRDQRGFYGKFLRYRRIEDEDHGVHHGISVGTEHGAGAFGISFEFGAAKSSRNHWAFTAQLGFKLTFPVVVPLSRTPGTDPGS